MWKQQLLKSQWVFKDVVSTNKAAQLNNLLPSPVQITSNLPFAYHFIYANPSSPNSELSTDGYDSYQAPPSFLRRLWIGGSIVQHTPIELGSQILLVERVRSIKDISDSTIVETERSFSTATKEGEKIALTEMRRLIYMNKPFIRTPARVRNRSALHTDKIKLSPMHLLRYSALTYNGHKIHYDRKYTREVEQYPDILIHGPLLLNIIINFVRCNMPAVDLQKVSYRNYAPLFVSDQLQLNLGKHNEKLIVWITNDKAEICCEGIIG